MDAYKISHRIFNHDVLKYANSRSFETPQQDKNEGIAQQEFMIFSKQSSNCLSLSCN